MEKLMKPSEYAKEAGISRQAVYAKIKRGILTARIIEGKLCIIVEKPVKEEAVSMTEKPTVKTSLSLSEKTNSASHETKDYEALLQAKDETISVLKGTVKGLKKSNKQISKTLRGEIDLLKEAFHEMRTLYVHQLEYRKPQELKEVFEVISEEDTIEAGKERWIGLKKFFKEHNISKDKHKQQTTKRFIKAYMAGDDRLIKREGELKFNANKTYEDILNQ